MLDVLTDFVVELERAGLAVSPQEVIDAAQAIETIALDDESTLKSALSATLLKTREQQEAFSSTFDLYFSRRLQPLAVVGDDTSTAFVEDDSVEPSLQRGRASQGLDAQAMSEMTKAALASGDERALRLAARLAVEYFAGIEPGRPVGVSYYLFRTLRGLGIEGLIASLINGVREGLSNDDSLSDYAHLGELGQRLVMEEYGVRAEQLRHLIEQAIMEALVADRGVDAVAAGQRKTALSDVDFMHATRDELAGIRRALFPLARLLAVRLAQRRRHHLRGPLDFRATIRRSLSTGGVPIEPRFASPHPKKPELVVIADVSGSVASFARFTIQLVYAISSQFSKVQSFVFVDGLDDVTSIFRRSSSVTDAIERVAEEADVNHRDGHSDYGHAFSIFCDQYLSQINARTDVLILGDARNNYHSSRAELLEKIARKSRHLFWLNPEPRAYWGSGDSIIGEYAEHCDAVVECRNLGQLELFISSLA